MWNEVRRKKSWICCTQPFGEEPIENIYVALKGSLQRFSQLIISWLCWHFNPMSSQCGLKKCSIGDWNPWHPAAVPLVVICKWTRIHWWMCMSRMKTHICPSGAYVEPVMENSWRLQVESSTLSATNIWRRVKHNQRRQTDLANWPMLCSQ